MQENVITKKPIGLRIKDLSMMISKNWSVLLLGLYKKTRNKILHFTNLKKYKTMIDTICLLIPKDQMTYLNGTSSWELYSKTDQLSLIHISEPTRLGMISYAVFCLKK